MVVAAVVAAGAVEAVVVLCTGWLALPENASSYGFQDLLDLCVALFSLKKNTLINNIIITSYISNYGRFFKTAQGSRKL